MDIPLKSQPKVSTVSLLDDSKFQPVPIKKNINHNNNDNDNIKHSHELNIPKSQNKLASSTNSNSNFSYRSTRRFSETEKNNFDQETGHRIYEDGKIRPHVNIQELQKFNDEQDQSPPKLYSRSHDSNIDTNFHYNKGLEDEYIPGLDFAEMIHQWNNNHSELDLSRKYTINSGYTITNPNSNLNSVSNTPRSKEASYLDLNLLHAKVAPQPIRPSNSQQHQYSNTKLHEYIKKNHHKFKHSLLPEEEEKNEEEPIVALTSDRIKKSNEALATASNEINNHKRESNFSSGISKKQKPGINPITGEVNYEMIINSLPPNFIDLPYSQRKKIVHSFNDAIDYSQFSVFAKNYLGTSIGSSSGGHRTSRSGSVGGLNSNNNSFIRKSRLGSGANTVANRLLQRTSTTDLKTYPYTAEPKYNVDEKGAFVMNYELGKIIGFGAWGTIRECIDKEGNIKAIKIVKSTRESLSRNNSRNNSRTNLHDCSNPKVLEVFKKEISIWKTLNHENILPLIDYLETEDAIFCIMNRINGGTLFELVSSWGQYNSGINATSGSLQFSIRNQRNRLSKVIDSLKQIVKALLYMHEEKGIVHGDIKLENVLLEKVDNESKLKMILCDFGMSRVYSMRISRKASSKKIPSLKPDSEAHSNFDDEVLMMRSKSSNTELRKPYNGGDTRSTKNLDFNIKDDMNIGVSNLFKTHGPSLQSVPLTPDLSPATTTPTDFSPCTNYFDFSKKHWTKYSQQNEKLESSIDSELPHSHIGSLPYASPEILQPSPPPLGPSADVWALGVLIYAMCVGKLPFQHQYEPRLRAIITAGKFDRLDLKKACLLEWIFKESQNVKSDTEDEQSSGTGIPASVLLKSESMTDSKRQDELHDLQKEWKDYLNSHGKEFEWLYEIVIGCLEINITKRWDMEMINDYLEHHTKT